MINQVRPGVPASLPCHVPWENALMCAVSLTRGLDVSRSSLSCLPVGEGEDVRRDGERPQSDRGGAAVWRGEPAPVRGLYSQPCRRCLLQEAPPKQVQSPRNLVQWLPKWGTRSPGGLQQGCRAKWMRHAWELVGLSALASIKTRCRSKLDTEETRSHKIRCIKILKV